MLSFFAALGGSLLASILIEMIKAKREGRI